jgi:hypothetical protein
LLIGDCLVNSHEIIRQVLSAVAALLMVLLSGFAFVVVPSHLHVEGVAMAPRHEPSRASVAQAAATTAPRGMRAHTGATAARG